MGKPTSKSKVVEERVRWWETRGPTGRRPCAARVAMTSLIAGPISDWMEVRGMVRRIAAMMEDSERVTWGSVSNAGDSVECGDGMGA